MPLREHFRPPVSKKSSWEGFHATWPTWIAVETEPPDEYEYEVRIYDVERERQLVAAIEFVSLANKDRRESREPFVARCAALLRKGVAVSIVDLVTIRRFNLYAQLMEFVGHPDPTMTPDGPSIYAASCRWPTRGTRASSKRGRTCWRWAWSGPPFRPLRTDALRHKPHR